MIEQRWRDAKHPFESLAVMFADGKRRVLQYRKYITKTSTKGVIGLEYGEWTEWQDVPLAGE